MEHTKSFQNSFAAGLRDGVPIGLGYFSVSMTFGILCVLDGLPVWAAVAISMTKSTASDIPTAEFSFLDTPRKGQMPRNWERTKLFTSRPPMRMASRLPLGMAPVPLPVAGRIRRG